MNTPSDSNWFPILSYDQSFAMRLEEVVTAFGDRTAVEVDEVSISFSELNRRANAIAHRLREDSTTDQPIALLLGNNDQMICSMFAVWKLNRIAVPLDPSYPESRIKYILNDSCAELLVTNEILIGLSRKINHARRQIVQIDSKYGDANWETVLESDDGRSGALLIYTSGSTGTPKGILHSHRNWLHGMSTGTAYQLKLNCSDRYSLLHSCSFSAGIGDLLNSILYGATLCIWDLKRKGDEGLSEWMRNERITIFDQSPSLFRHFISDFERGLVWNSVRGVLLGSEPVTRTDFEIFKKYFSDECVFVNRLGTSESLGYHLSVLNRNSVVRDEVIPTDIEVKDLKVELDESAHEEEGLGEILVHGDYLAIGYWNLPDETERRFKIDPISGSRYYRTGDLGRFDKEGRLHFVGRNDFQIQIRGHRVEVAEIENALNENPDIQDCAVIARKDSSGELGLVAFYRSKSSRLDPQLLDSELREKLPSYMVPAKWARVEGFPLTPSGKLDRRELLKWEISPRRSSILEPTTEVEMALVEIWSTVLAVESVSVSDNFFSLGGHSILVFRVLALIRRKVGVSLSASEFYGAQTLSDLGRLIERSRGKGDSSDIDIANSHSPRSSDVPASFAQKRLWLLGQLEDSDRHYHLPQACKLFGELDVEALEQAFIDLVEGQEALRTVLYQVDDKVYQRVIDVDRRLFRYRDISGLPDEEKSNEISNTIKLIAKSPFELSADMMVRAVLLKANAGEYVLAWCIHHIAGDGWSLMLFRQELAELYEAKTSGKDDTPPRPLVQYSDYSAAQIGRLESPEIERQIDYWVEELKDGPELHSLPLKDKRPVVQSFEGAEYRIRVDRASLEQIKSRCRESRTTLFAYLMACYYVLIYRYSGQSDVVVGTPVAGRLEEGQENTIGFFANTLALRMRVLGETAFNDFLSQVHRKLVEAFDHQSAPFEVVVERLNPARSLGHTPVFQTMLAMQNAIGSDFALKGIKLEMLPIELGASKFDLTVNFTERLDEIWLNVEYSTALFNRAMIAELMGSFVNLALRFAANASQNIGSVPLLMESSEREIAAEVGEKVARRPEFVTSLFEQQVEESPHDVGLVFDGHSLTYCELSQRVDELTSSLLEAGIGGCSGVAVFLERSVEMVTGLLAVLKLGGYFIPLDPELPDSRLNLVIEEADIRCFLTDSRLLTRIKREGSVVLVDQVQRVNVERVAPAALCQQNEGDLAYVIFTSGSTGKPKGVAISRGSLANLLCSMQQEPGIAKDDRLLAITTISFDIAILEVFLPLISGATLILARREEAQDGRQLQRKLEEEGVTILQGTPSTWQLLWDAGWRGREKVKALCGGEAMSARLKRDLLDTGCELWNLYGPTETTIWSAIEKVEDYLPYPTIGAPIQNTELYIMNEFLQIQPVEVWGELYIGGEGLAKGYLNRSDLTQKAFIEHPFRPGQRLYKTGDRVRRTREGKIQYDGRLDNQVKIRGFRIELGEIESILELREDVDRSIALVRRKESGETDLIVFVKRRPETAVGIAELRSWLVSRLPAYMLPTSWTLVDYIPLTPNGKIDRKALLRLSAEEKATQAWVEPRTDTERALAKIWRKALRVKRISVRDNFFETGGHSMLAAAMFARIEREMSVSLPLSALFQAPTIESLAAYIDQGSDKEKWSTLVPIQPEGRRVPLFLIHGAEGNVLLYRELAHSLSEDQPVYGFQASGLDGVSSPASTIEEMAESYIDRISEIQPTGPYCLAGYCLGGTIAYEMGIKLREAGQEVAFIGLFETYNMWSVSSRKSLVRKNVNKALNVYFHLASLFSLPRSQQKKFFFSKLDVERSRMKLNVDYYLNKWNLRDESNSSLASQHLRVREVNDRAQILYNPKPYSGAVTVFKPSRYFLGFEDPYLGWKEAVEGEIHVCSLPVYPKSMLTPPFSQILAQDLERSLADSLANSR